MTTDDGKALRALLSPSERRHVTQAARAAADGLWAALNSVDDLLEVEIIHDLDTVVLSDAEQIALGHARTAILSAFHALKVGAPDLAGLVPAEAMASTPTMAQVAESSEAERAADHMLGPIQHREPPEWSEPNGFIDRMNAERAMSREDVLTSEGRTAHYVVQTTEDVSAVFGPFPTDEIAVQWAGAHLMAGSWFYAPQGKR